jgi:O-methyltransferase
MVKPPEIAPLKSALRVAARKLATLTHAHQPMMFPTYSTDVCQRINQYHDDVRYSTLALAVQRLESEHILGAFAEVGVYRGLTSFFIHKQAPERHLYLFDTFEGFPKEDLEVDQDRRFRETSLDFVANFLGKNRNIEFRKGYFPKTAIGLEDERFALVMLDVDLYRPARETLLFFYPRMVRGGYFFLHDFNSEESDHAIERAATQFMIDKPELILEIPDVCGSVFFRKI